MLEVSSLSKHFGGLSALWAYLEQLAPSFGLSAQNASAILSVSLLASGLAGLTAAGVGDRALD